jgi:hypothetical protein
VADAGYDHALGVGDEDLAARRAPPRRHRALEFALQPAIGLVTLRLFQPLQALDQKIGAAFDLLDDVADRLPTMIQHLHDRTDANRQQKCDDQRRNGASQGRLGREQPPIGRLGDRLS